MEPKITIAIAESEPIFREGLYSAIKGFDGFDINIVAENGKDLIDKIYGSKYLPNICILDINIPILNGYEVTKIIKDNWPIIKVIVLSRYKGKYAISHMIKNGAKTFLPKNTNVTDLHIALLSTHLNNPHYSDILSKDFFTSIVNETKRQSELTEREIEIIKLVKDGFNYYEIGNRINISFRTVQKHCNNVFAKLNIHSKEELILFAVNNGF